MSNDQKRNLLTIAVEDYFQATALKPLVKEKQWEYLESRVELNTRRTLDFLDQFGHKATFFVLGWVAEKLPELVKEIADRGHEVASKGYFPHRLQEMSRKAFRQDVLRARDALEKASGLEVLGHRIAKGHLSGNDLWALDTLTELGFAYDSSVYPRFRSVAREPWRRFPHYHHYGDRELLEIPLSTWGIGSMLFPVAGGNYMRQLPPRLMQKAVAHWVESYESPFNMYFHVWELDPDLPRISSAGWLQRLRQYRNLRRMPGILGYYLRTYKFESIATSLGLTPAPSSARPPDQRAPKRIASLLRVDKLGPERGADLDAVTIIIPCFNEERVLPYLAKVLEDLRTSLGKRYDLSFLFIDDGSTDGTYQTIVEQFEHREDCDIIRHDSNLGIAAAILTGIKSAHTEIICSIDCDGSYDPHQLEAMIPMLKPDVAMVTASPYHPLGEAVGVQSWRLALSQGLSRIYRRILTHKFSTYTSCFRVYRKSAMQDLKVRNQGFLGVVEIFTILDAEGANLVECPAVLEARILGQSKMKTLRTILGHLRLVSRVIMGRIFRRRHRSTP
jgi:polysaccharide deacetylase family protein (PEP-CTERM system associated)